MTGMTLKQAGRQRFVEGCRRLRELRGRTLTPDEQAEFVRVSVATHAAKQFVPRRMWPQANK